MHPSMSLGFISMRHIICKILNILQYCINVIMVFLFLSYVVTLVADGVRNVRNFNFDKAAASVLTSCVGIIPSSAHKKYITLKGNWCMTSRQTTY